MRNKFLIEGGIPLSGTVKISGAKNAALPILAATLLSADPITLQNIPILEDVKTMCALLEVLGKSVKISENTVHVEENKAISQKAPYEIVSKMRASIAVMGPLLTRFGKAIISMPGGCSIGLRPIDLHIKGMICLSASCAMENGYLQVFSKEKLIGSRINLTTKHGSSVLATENIMMAAVLASGTTVIEGAAKEPEISDLAKFLNLMGADIQGDGTDTITIKGVSTLFGTEHKIIPDRIETGTFIVAAGITGGEIEIQNCDPSFLNEEINVFRRSGMDIIVSSPSSLHVKLIERKATNIITGPYPGFPTDLQSQILSYLSITKGNSIVTDTIYPERFVHAAELNRMGAHIEVNNGTASINGVKELSNTEITSSDLRGGAALVLAALATHGKSYISEIYHIDRGYENLEKKLEALGARIRRV